ncbi:hypothetical protein BLA3211_07054 [Burkholderia aenigmatica]|uniref:Uncharacterized protein n=1 Tax=Burkholderia aenigmatica TaxID=2015348 RepID=A0A6J5JMN8_9BURK|nr:MULTISPECIES: hypothetical protein [Burkholderia]CAB3972608.1 hypothetical protein BLA3211_07054 [Burkholderia aenigmatica]
MLYVSYPCTAIDAWTRIRDELELQGMASVVPIDPVLDRSTWRFETRIDGLPAKTELALTLKFNSGKDVESWRA